MKEKLPIRFGIIQKMIIILAVFAMSVIWPLGAFPVSQVSSCQWDGQRMSGPSSEAGFVRQEFSPNFEKLQEISVYVVNNPDSFDTMKAVLRVYDYTGACLSETFFQLENYELPGFVTIPVDLKLSPGILYFYTVGGVDGELLVAYCGDEAKTAENGALFYKEIASGGTSIVTEYVYERPMGMKRILLCDAGLLFICAVVLFGINCVKNSIFKHQGEQAAQRIWRKVENIIRYGITGILLLGVITAFVGIVVMRLFTDDILNLVVLFAGVLIAAGYLCYGVFTCKSELEPLTEGEAVLLEKGIRLLRVLLFTGTFLMCCMYINGYTDYEKGLYLRRMLVFFGLFLVSLGKRRQIFGIPSLVWSIAALIGGKYYISLHSDHIEHINTATNNAWVMWVIGLLVIQIIYRLGRESLKKLKDISIPFLIVSLLFWIGSIVFSNGRTWPALLCVLMLVWIFFYTTSGNREQILQDICNGILVAFAGTVIFCLYRRPYQYFMLTRYGGIFFTATTTATYYLVPAAAALTVILLALKEGNKRKLIFSSCLFGVIAAYMGFTASRTGIISLAVMVLFAFFLPWRGAKKNFLKRKMRALGVLTVSVIATFIMTFGATRMIPAMAGNPFYFWYEQPNAYFTKDTPWKGGESLSETYIDIQMTLEMLFGRLFVVEEKEPEASEAEVSEAEIVLGPLLASAKETVNLEDSGQAVQYANGRMEIFRTYLEQLNFEGHDTMSAIDANGEPLMHAHNSYLQAAFDFGIPMGILFLIFCFAGFCRGVSYAYQYAKKSSHAFFPLLTVTGFGVASIFEWVYHIANPLGFAFLIVLAPLMIKEKKKSDKLENR